MSNQIEQTEEETLNTLVEVENPVVNLEPTETTVDPKVAAKAEKEAKAAAAKAEKEAKAAAAKAEKARIKAEKEAKIAEKARIKAEKEEPKKEVTPSLKQNGITMPKEGSQSRKIWDICNKLSEVKGSVIERKKLMGSTDVTEFNSTTVSVQFGKWKTFYGLDK
jgi:membrane protein involved in colicin uptake